MQTTCVDLLPSARFPQELSALLCGKNLSAGEMKNKLKATSLLHQFVVSGGHLIFIMEIFKLLQISNSLISCLLIFYTMLTGLQPPVVRALIQQFAEKLFRQTDNRTSSHRHILISGIGTLVLFPRWCGSLSLSLSWISSLGTRLIHRRRKKPTPADSPRFQFYSHAAVFLLTLLALIGLSPTHPLGVLCNLLIGPCLSFILFPIAILTAFRILPVFVFDGSIETLSQILDPIHRLIPGGASESFSMPVIWFYIFAVHLLIEWASIIHQRYWRYRGCGKAHRARQLRGCGKALKARRWNS